MSESPAPYDVPEAITEVAKLIVSPVGQEAFLRLLGERGISLADLHALWEQDEKAQPPIKEAVGGTP